MTEMIERCGAAMMRTDAGRRLMAEFTDMEIANFTRAAIEAATEPTPEVLSDLVYDLTVATQGALNAYQYDAAAKAALLSIRQAVIDTPTS